MPFDHRIERIEIDPRGGWDDFPVPAGEDTSSPALVRQLIERFTSPGDAVLDPFAGSGTTLVAAERLGREGWGIERNPRRAALARGFLERPKRLLSADARRIGELALPPIDLCLSSPPFMERAAPASPLAAPGEPPRGYDGYLAELRCVYTAAAGLLRPYGRLVVEAATIRSIAGVTDLAGDIARVLGVSLPFLGEIEARRRAATATTRCLVFGAVPVSNRPADRSNRAGTRDGSRPSIREDNENPRAKEER